MKSRALNLAALALLVGLFGSIDGVMRPAAAQQLDAGKPPAQIFAGTCSACHRSPRGLVRSISPGGLPGFLRQHYTTGNDMAGTMAAYVLGNGGTQQVAEPPPKREPKQEPKQRAKPDAQEAVARTPEPKEQSKSARQKAAKKGQPEPSAKDAPPDQEPDKADAAKPDVPAATPEAPAADSAKPETAAVECKIEQPEKQADEAKPGFAMPSAPPRQPAALLTLPGFPVPEPEPEPEPVATQGGCEPAANTATPVRADVSPVETPKEQVNDQPKEAVPAASPPAPSPPAASPATPPAALAEAPNSEPLRASVSEPAPLDIMQEEVHAPRPVRPSQQKKRAP